MLSLGVLVERNSCVARQAAMLQLAHCQMQAHQRMKADSEWAALEAKTASKDPLYQAWSLVFQSGSAATLMHL